MIEIAGESEEQAFLLALDYKKAFDMVNWDLLFRALHFFNFGNEFVESIQMLFRGIETCILNAGYTSSYFSPTNGVRQGCCASPLLFVIAVELQALMIRNNANIRGVTVHNTQYKISQFADDTTCFAEGQDSLRALLSSLELFSSYSGLRLNYEKSTLVYIGKGSVPLTSHHGLPIKTAAKILGIWFSKGRSEEEHYTWNYSPVLDTMRKRCLAWNNRSLSLKGKITVFNVLVGSMIQYITMNTTTPARVIKETARIATQFLWDGKKSKIAYQSIIQSIKNGGLGLMDLNCRRKANHISWIKRILREPRSSSAEMIRTIIGEENLGLALGYRRPTMKGDHHIPTFYVEMLDTWYEVRDSTPLTEKEIREEVIWSNHLISSPQHMLKHSQWRGWIEAGVTLIHHLCHDTDDRLLGHEEIQEKFQIRCNFLEALTVRNSIPYAWRTQVSANFREETALTHAISINQKRFDISTSSPKQWYSEWVATLGRPFSRAERWEEELLPSVPAADLDWPSIFLLPYKTTRETKLQSFAYKTAYRIIPCNRYLRQVRIKEADTCDFCEEVDSLSHFFLKCRNVKTFWEQLMEWCAEYTDISLEGLNEAELLFGVLDRRRNRKVTNWLIIFAKYYIQKRRLFAQGSIPLIAFLREARLKIHLERRACYAENKIRKFRPWQGLYEALG